MSENASSHATPGSPRRARSATRVMVVDDDASLAQALERALTVEGYEVAVVCQSLRVFDRAREWRPDVILMDVEMPYLDGFDQVKLLSLADEVAHVPVILMTATGDTQSQLSGQARQTRQIVAWVGKPLDLAVVLGKIAALRVAR